MKDFRFFCFLFAMSFCTFANSQIMSRFKEKDGNGYEYIKTNYTDDGSSIEDLQGNIIVPKYSSDYSIYNYLGYYFTVSLNKKEVLYPGSTALMPTICIYSYNGTKIFDALEKGYNHISEFHIEDNGAMWFVVYKNKKQYVVDIHGKSYFEPLMTSKAVIYDTRINKFWYFDINNNSVYSAKELDLSVKGFKTKDKRYEISYFDDKKVHKYKKNNICRVSISEGLLGKNKAKNDTLSEEEANRIWNVVYLTKDSILVNGINYKYIITDKCGYREYYHKISSDMGHTLKVKTPEDVKFETRFFYDPYWGGVDVLSSLLDGELTTCEYDMIPVSDNENISKTTSNKAKKHKSNSLVFQHTKNLNLEDIVKRPPYFLEWKENAQTGEIYEALKSNIDNNLLKVELNDKLSCISVNDISIQGEYYPENLPYIYDVPVDITYYPNKGISYVLSTHTTYDKKNQNTIKNRHSNKVYISKSGLSKLHNKIEKKLFKIGYVLHKKEVQKYCTRFEYRYMGRDEDVLFTQIIIDFDYFESLNMRFYSPFLYGY